MKHSFKTFLTVGQLKEIIADMADDAIVSARDRDCICLDKVHIVNHTNIPTQKGYEDVYFVKSIDDVYGGDRIELDNKSKQAIIFCDCD